MSEAIERIRAAVLRLRPRGSGGGGRRNNENNRGDDDNDDDDDEIFESALSLGPLGLEIQRLRRRIGGARDFLSAHEDNDDDDDDRGSNGGSKRMKMNRPKKIIPKRTWYQRMEHERCAPPRKRMNEIIMNLLVIEGYKDVAEEFQREANVEPPVPLETIEQRMTLRTHVSNGRIGEALLLLNEMEPDVLSEHPQLRFHLLEQQLIEIIRSGDVSGAVTFAREQLAPLLVDHVEYRSSVEQIMTMLVFPEPDRCPLSHLLDVSRRSTIASELNEAVLSSQHAMKDAMLPQFIKRLSWRQQKLTEVADFPVLETTKSSCKTSKFSYSKAVEQQTLE